MTFELDSFGHNIYYAIYLILQELLWPLSAVISSSDTGVITPTQKIYTRHYTYTIFSTPIPVVITQTQNSLQPHSSYYTNTIVINSSLQQHSKYYSVVIARTK